MTEPTFSGDLGLYKPMQLYRLSATSGVPSGKNGDYTGIGGGVFGLRLAVSGLPLSRASRIVAPPLPQWIFSVHKYPGHKRSPVGASLLAIGPAQALKILIFLLHQPGQSSKRVMRRLGNLRRAQRPLAEILLVGVARVLVIVAIQAQQLPVRTILRIVVMVMVAVMHGQFAQTLAGKLTGAAAAYVRVHLQGLVAVTHFLVALVIGEDAIQLLGIGRR